MLDGVTPPTEVTNPEDYIDRVECTEDLNKTKTVISVSYTEKI
jgi:hypothetical protein